jgi:prepilin-type processing-associated H-X9-DG protein
LVTPTATDGARVPVFADGMLESANPLEADTPPDNLSAPDFIEPTPERPLGMKMFCIARHGRAINVVFLDGHAATTPLEELWRLKWHNQWVGREVTLPVR